MLDGQLGSDGALMGVLTADLPRDDIELALEQITQALAGYDHAEEYDSINIWEQTMISRAGRTLRQADIEFDPNFCSPVINAVNDRLLITSITASSGAATDTAASEEATAELASIQRANALGSRYRSWNRNALRDGDGYIIVWPTQIEGPQAQNELNNDLDVTDGLGPDAAGVTVTYADPRMCRMFYDPENPNRKLFFAQMWETRIEREKHPRVRLNLFYPDRIEKWISQPGTKQKKATEFEPYYDPDDDGDNDYPGAGEDDDADAPVAASWPQTNPYGQIPVFHLRTEFEYGMPEHRNAFALQDAISKLIEMLMVTAEFQGYPQRYAIQEADSLGTQSIREDPLAEHSPQDWDHDITETALSTTSVVSGAISNETGSNYEASPGAMQVYKGFKEVSQFSTANPASFLDPLKTFVTHISTTTDTPMWKFAGLGGTTPSGEALRIAESPLVQKVQDRMAMFGGAWAEAYEFALLIRGIHAQVTVAWANPATSEMKDVWDLVKMQIELGVPRATAFMKAGVSEAEAQEWAKTYDDVFATAAYYQGRATMYIAQADLLKQQAVAAKIANGVPQLVALSEAGWPEHDVQAWLVAGEEQRTLERKVQIGLQIAQMMQSFGMAAQLNVISPEGANAILVNLFGDLLPEIPSTQLEVDDPDPDAPDEAAFPHGAPPRPPFPPHAPGDSGPSPIPGVSGLPLGTPGEVHLFDPNN